MVSEILEPPVLERPESLIRDSRSRGLESRTTPEKADVWTDSEHEDDLLMSLGWIRNIG